MVALVRTNYNRWAIVYRLWFIALLLILSACSPLDSAAPTQDDPLVGTIVALTMEAMTPQATPTLAFTPVPTMPPVTPTPYTAEVSGKVCYRDGSMSQLTIYFQNTATGQVIELPVGRPQTDYTIQLLPGTYRPYGWPPDFSIGVLYKGGTFVAAAGHKVTGIDLCDWEHGPFDVPYPPGFQPAEQFGTIAGSISGYPHGNLPRLTIVAFSQDTSYWYWVGTAAGQAYFTFTDLPVGGYQVVAYDASSHAGGCPTIVTVRAGETAVANITDWAGSYPANPVR